MSQSLKTDDNSDVIAQNHRMRFIALLAIGFALTACGSAADTEPTGADTSSAESTPEAPTTPAGESEDCRVAAVTWADRATDHVLEAATTAPAFGEQLDLSNLDDLQSQISVICSTAIDETVKDAMVPLSQLNFELSLCGFSGECDAPTAKKVRRLADKTAEFVGTVRGLAS